MQRTETLCCNVTNCPIMIERLWVKIRAWKLALFVLVVRDITQQCDVALVLRANAEACFGTALESRLQIRFVNRGVVNSK